MWKSKVGAAGIIAVGCSLRDRGCSLRDRALKAGQAPESGRRADEARRGPNGVPDSAVWPERGWVWRATSVRTSRRRPGARFGSRHACTPPTRTQPAPDPRPEAVRRLRRRVTARPLPPLGRACAPGGSACCVAPAAGGRFGLRVATSVRARACRIGHRGAVPSRSPGRPRLPGSRPRGPDRRRRRGRPRGVAKRCDSELLQTTGHVFVTLSKKPYEGKPRLLDQSSRYMRPTRALRCCVAVRLIRCDLVRVCQLVVAV